MIKCKEQSRCFQETGCAGAAAVHGSSRRMAGVALIMGLSLSVTACGGKEFGHHEKGVANPDTTQTSFAIMGAQSALSPGYDDNVVLNDLQADTGSPSTGRP